MNSIENPMDDMTHQSSFPNLEQMRVIMMSLNLILEEVVGTFSTPPSLDPFLP
jgi:hypothetical protein